MGVAGALLRGAIDFAAAHGAQIVEGYPVEPRSEDMPAVFAWTGIASTFRRAGFVEVLRRSETRPIMRYDIQGDIRLPGADAVVGTHVGSRTGRNTMMISLEPLTTATIPEDTIVLGVADTPIGAFGAVFTAVGLACLSFPADSLESATLDS